MLELTVCAEFDFSSADYAELFQQSDATAFQHPAWQKAMHVYAASQSDIALKTLLMRCPQSGKLMGVLPLVCRKRMGATILEYLNLGLVDYAMPILHRDFWNLAGDACTLAAEIRQVLGGYDLLRIKHMPAVDSALQRLFPGARMERACFSSYEVALSADYDGWRAVAISKSERKHRDKKRRAMDRVGGWEMARLQDPADIEAALVKMRQFHKARYADRPGEDLIQRPDVFRFYTDLAISEAASGFIRVYRFTHEGETVAVQYGVSHADRYLYLMMGVDYDRMGRFSPGLLMTEDIIRDIIADGFENLDLTIGDEPYKLKFGTTAKPIMTLWHSSSVLGAMGRSVATFASRSHISDRLRGIVG